MEKCKCNLTRLRCKRGKSVYVCTKCNKVYKY